MAAAQSRSGPAQGQKARTEHLYYFDELNHHSSRQPTNLNLADFEMVASTLEKLKVAVGYVSEAITEVRHNSGGASSPQIPYRILRLRC